MHTPTNQLNCLIVDDEPLAQEVLAAHIAKIPSLNLVQQCSNAMEAFEALHKNTIDLIFLDINMPVVSGLSFLRSLKDPPAVILTTAYTEYAMEGYELDVVDYLLKPVPFDRFFKAVKKASQQLSHTGRNVPVLQDDAPLSLPVQQTVTQVNTTEKNYFFIKADGKLVKVNYADIRYIEGMKDYLKIHCVNQSIVSHHTMKAMEEQLPSDKFMRVHKSYIIALGAIKSIDGNIITLDMDKAEIPLGSSFRDALLATVAANR
ncbi:LytR/AlgR family response regulator transcription factor [Taibaiella chishuiensis]|uniref:LytTR family two component transcriptional regulator n=1 Tax=Taibaiella chishuiensis TaxID=1434707 RepID=A0A2P8CV77_9BACT|nr:response regulator transcription factor [Taibaiella chishuiensis]PSK88868.1 LytTR family two component transcriptional regulator [Taibaiella chishuiensis]